MFDLRARVEKAAVMCPRPEIGGMKLFTGHITSEINLNLLTINSYADLRWFRVPAFRHSGPEKVTLKTTKSEKKKKEKKTLKPQRVAHLSWENRILKEKKIPI